MDENWPINEIARRKRPVCPAPIFAANKLALAMSLAIRQIQAEPMRQGQGLGPGTGSRRKLSEFAHNRPQ
jgi:hypothetical protein